MKLENNILYVSFIDDFVPFLNEHNALSLYFERYNAERATPIGAYATINYPPTWIQGAFFWGIQCERWRRLDGLWKNALREYCRGISIIRCSDDAETIDNIWGTASSERGE